jgi:hypothetical protein
VQRCGEAYVILSISNIQKYLKEYSSFAQLPALYLSGFAPSNHYLFVTIYIMDDEEVREDGDETVVVTDAPEPGEKVIVGVENTDDEPNGNDEDEEDEEDEDEAE